MEIKKLLIFDFKGPIAHFRKYYTNATALTYGVPPRTVITGLLAGILGIQRDEYYDLFSENNTRIAVKVNLPFRKTIQKVNYTNTQKGKITIGGNHQQIGLELLFPMERNLPVSFRIYFYNEKYIKELAERIQSNSYIYNPYLGLSEFLAEIEFVALLEQNNINIENNNEYTLINTMIRRDYVSSIDFSETNIHLIEERKPINFKDGEKEKHKEYISLHLIEERMPVNFKNSDDNNKRNLYGFADFLYEQNGKAINAVINEKSMVYSLHYLNTKENIVFLE